MNELLKLKEKVEKRYKENMKAYEKFEEGSTARLIFASAAKEDFDILSIIDEILEKEVDNE
jgi:ABC-type polysaccharide/polyol phosphate transport system ATPase subunit